METREEIENEIKEKQELIKNYLGQNSSWSRMRLRSLRSSISQLKKMLKEKDHQRKSRRLW